MTDEERNEPITRYVHFCQNVRGAIQHIEGQKRRIIPWITDDNGQPMTKAAVLEELRHHEAMGHRVIPLGEPCEGFDYQTGCPGHPQGD